MACLLLMAMILTACGSELSGRWVSASGTGTQLSFTSTGKAVMSLNGEELASGTYTAVNGRLTVTLIDAKGEAYVLDGDYRIEGNKLFWTNSRGFTETFIRK